MIGWIKAGWLAAVAAVVVASFVPAAAPPGAWGADKVLHFMVFLFLAAVPAAVLPRRPALLWAEVFVLAVGLGIELVQSFIPGRVGSGGDLLADALGVLIGIAVGRQVWRRLGLAMSIENAALDPQGPGK